LDLSISVVIVNWNSREDLRECLDSLASQDDRDFETVVVDNGSNDGSVAMVKSAYPDVRLVEAGENLGFAEGCNRGIDVATGAWIATLNNDACARPAWIAELRRAVRTADERLGMLQSKMLFKNRTDRTNSTGVLLFSNGNPKDRGFDELDGTPDADRDLFCASAGAALYRRRMLEEIRLSCGIFDRSFFMYFEDVDLGWRCRLAGWSAVYVPSAVVVHAFHASSKRLRSDFVVWQCRKNRACVLAKNASFGFLVRTLPRSLGDLIWVLRARGVPGLRQYAADVSRAAKVRPEVDRLQRVSRTAVERRWVTKRSRS
jgi:GT2 family glycosyltransferase